MSILANYTVSYAQNREDIIIESFFPDLEKGFYVDVGANHPVRHSVTKRLYDKGWRGINIEPNPDLFELISQYRPEDDNQNIGISNAEGRLNFRIYHSRDGLAGLSTFSQSMKAEYDDADNQDTANYTDVDVEVTTLEKLFKKRKVTSINFIKIDVEGYEDEVIQGNDWKKYRPELICIEANHLKADWEKRLSASEYKLVFNDGLNDYYLAKESMQRLKFFDYSQTMLLDKPVINSDLAEDLGRIHTDIKKLVKTNNELNDQVQGLHLENINILQQRNDLFKTLERYNNLRSLVRLLAIKLHRRNLVKINELKKPKKYSKAPKMTTSNFKELSTLDLLSVAHDYDLKSLTPRSRYLSTRFYLYHILNTLYGLITQIAKKLVKILKRIKGVRK